MNALALTLSRLIGNSSNYLVNQLIGYFVVNESASFFPLTSYFVFVAFGCFIGGYRSRMGGGPSQILCDVNEQLCRNDKSGTFVTVWLGILDLRTGTMTCANAGHEFPMIRAGDGVFRQFTDRHGLPLGIMPGARYQDYVIRMRSGDAVFVYTDGVPEANNASGELYTLARMELALNQITGRDPRSVLEGVRADVDAFVLGTAQFDDLTMLCVTYHGYGDHTEDT